MLKNLLIGAITVVLVAIIGIAGYTVAATRGLDPVHLEAAYMQPSDNFIDVRGARVRVRQEGPSDAPALVFLHGFTFSLESWDGWAERLSRDYRVIRFDLLGHGLTGPDSFERYSPAARAVFIGDLLDALEIERASLIGNSLGGLAAWRFAASAPERVASLVLVAPGVYPINGVGDDPVPAPPAVAAFLKTAPEPMIRASMQLLYADDTKITPERLTLMRDMMRRRGNGEAFVKSLEAFTLPDPEPMLAQITAPTLIIWGAQDMLLPVAHGAQMAAVIPDAQLLVHEGLGHVPHEEAPDDTIGGVMMFLASHASRAPGAQPAPVQE